MSSEQRVDPQLIEQTKQQIRTLVNEIAQLAKSELSPAEFYAEFLPRLVSSLAAVGGVVWTLTEQGQLAVQYQMNYQESGLAQKSREEQIQHLMLLHKIVKEGDGAIIQPHSGYGSEEDGSNPTDWLLILGPLKTELEPVGVVEIFQRADSGANTQKGYLKFLQQMCDLAADFLKTRQLRNFSDRQTLWTRLEEFSRLIHASLDPRETAYVIANEARRLIECDRVSIALKRGRKCVIEAVSGQDMVDKRSNTVRMLGELATVVVNAGEPVWYHGDTKDLAPQIEDKLQEYVDEAHTKALAVLPLQRTLPPPDPEKERLNQDEIPEPFGAIIVEQIEDSRIPMTMVQRIEVVRGHSTAAIANAVEHNSLFLMPVWRTLGKSKILTSTRYLPKTLLALIGVVALLAVLIFVPKDFKLHSVGELKPVVRQDVFAGVNGNVDRVCVQHGQHVTRQELLLTLQNFKLGEQIESTWGEHASTVKQIEGAKSMLTRKTSAEEQMQLHNEISELEARRDSLAKQYGILMDEWNQLQVRSPVDGEVMTWDIENKLRERPVQQGAFLMQIADPDGPWELELQVPEDRMGCIAKEQIAHNAVARQAIAAVDAATLATAIQSLQTEAATLTSEMTALQTTNTTVETAVVGTPVEPSTGLATDASGTDAAAMSGTDSSSSVSSVGTPLPSSAGGDTVGENVGESATVSGSANAANEPKANSQDATRLAVLEKRFAIVQKLIALCEQMQTATPESRAILVEQIPGALVYDMMVSVFGEGNFTDPRLQVEFVLATEPSQIHIGRVVELHDYAEIVDNEQGVTVQVRVTFDKTLLRPEHIRQGATVSAKILCGREPVGYCWFYDLITWAKRTWFHWCY